MTLLDIQFPKVYGHLVPPRPTHTSAPFSPILSLCPSYNMQHTVQWTPLVIIADNVINRLLLSKSVVPKHSI